MVKHIILWQLKEDLKVQEKEAIKEDIKKGLEGLKESVPGILDIRVQTETLESSNVDLMLDASFENVEALQAYAVHPEHVKVADEKVRPFTQLRSCIDFEK